MSTSEQFIQPGIIRLPISEWARLWNEDPDRWQREIRDRPTRFDGVFSHRAVREWRNVIPDDERRVSSPGPRALEGVPFLVKDLYNVAGEITGCSSRVMLETIPRDPAKDDAFLVAKLRNLGAIPVGRTHMNEFAYGLDGKNAYVGDCLHPLDSTRIPGGSSSGSAWSVAAGVVPLALGSDTGGSMRVPAAFCGVFGYRPAWDPMENQGVFPLASSFDTTGWFAANGHDMNRMIRVLVPSALPDRNAGPGAGPLRFWYYTPPSVTIDEELRRALDRWVDDLQRGGNGSVAVEAPPDEWRRRADEILEDSLEAYNVVGSREAWETHREWLDPYRDSYQPVVWSLIDRGRHWREERLVWARTVVRKTRELFLEATERVTGVLMPATPVVTPGVDEIDSRYRHETIRLNAPGSMSGAPVLSAPFNLDAIRSSGMQVLVAPGREGDLLSLLDILKSLRRGT